MDKRKKSIKIFLLILVCIVPIILFTMLFIHQKEIKIKYLKKQDAINYFIKQYDTDKSKIKVVDYWYRVNEYCTVWCLDNEDDGYMIIKYKGKEYTLWYDEEKGWYIPKLNKNGFEIDDE